MAIQKLRNTKTKGQGLWIPLLITVKIFLEDGRVITLLLRNIEILVFSFL